jgi:hypothetical protein
MIKWELRRNKFDRVRGLGYFDSYIVFTTNVKKGFRFGLHNKVRRIK